DCLLKSDMEALVPAIRRAMHSGTSGPGELYLRGLERLAQVSLELSRCRDMEAVVSQVGRAAREMSGSDAAVLSLREGELCHVIGEDSATPFWKGRRFPLKETITGWVIEHNQPMVADDMNDPRVSAGIYRTTYVKSLAVVPFGKPEAAGTLSNLWRGR